MDREEKMIEMIQDLIKISINLLESMKNLTDNLYLLQRKVERMEEKDREKNN